MSEWLLGGWGFLGRRGDDGGEGWGMEGVFGKLGFSD